MFGIAHAGALKTGVYGRGVHQCDNVSIQTDTDVGPPGVWQRTVGHQCGNANATKMITRKVDSSGCTSCNVWCGPTEVTAMGSANHQQRARLCVCIMTITMMTMTMKMTTTMDNVLWQ